jgi:hypothetical protein
VPSRIREHTSWNFGAVSVRWCLRLSSNGMEEVNGETSLATPLVPHQILDEIISFLEGEIIVFGR